MGLAHLWTFVVCKQVLYLVILGVQVRSYVCAELGDQVLSKHATGCTSCIYWVRAQL